MEFTAVVRPLCARADTNGKIGRPRIHPDKHCKRCGALVSRHGHPIHCAACVIERRKEREAENPPTCVDCGAPVWKGSTRCRPCNQPLSQPRTCVGCGATFKPKRTGNKGLYCSRDCAFSHRTGALHSRWSRDKKGPYSPVFFYACAECGADFTASRKGKRYCGEVCSSVVAARRKAESLRDLRAATALRNETVVVVCSVCAGEFKRANGQRKLCSKACAKKARRRSPSGKAAKAKYKAKRRGAVKADAINPYVVFLRDGWTCQGCGCNTPRKLRGMNQDDSPELDHIIPLAKGGAHSYDNAQTLCRVCNILKGADDMGNFVHKHSLSRASGERLCLV